MTKREDVQPTFPMPVGALTNISASCSAASTICFCFPLKEVFPKTEMPMVRDRPNKRVMTRHTCSENPSRKAPTSVTKVHGRDQRTSRNLSSHYCIKNINGNHRVNSSLSEVFAYLEALRKVRGSCISASTFRYRLVELNESTSISNFPSRLFEDDALSGPILIPTRDGNGSDQVQTDVNKINSTKH